MKKNILFYVLGLISAISVVYATDVLIPAASISFESEYTDKTNVADALDELLENQQGSLICPEGYNCEYEGKKYMITYQSNGGDLVYTNDFVVYGHRYDVLIEPKKEGYAFGGWYLDNGLTKYVGNETKVKIAENHTLYAMWGSPVEVTFEANGGKLTTSTKEVTQNGRYGTLPRGYKEGYILEGWYSDSELTNKVTESTKVTNENNHTLYAKWIESTKPALYDVVLNQLNTTKKSENITSSDNGVYEYNSERSSDGGELPIYFYRGAVTNNNVLFAGYCWKIVRTTQTGGVKMIYSGDPTGTAPNYVCNNGRSSWSSSFSQNGSTFYGTFYKYSTSVLHGVELDSDIKTYIEQTIFYNSNFVNENNLETADYKNLIEDTPYCIDRRYAATSTEKNISSSTIVNTPMYFGPYIRSLNEQKPTLYCYHNTQNDTDRLTLRGGQLAKKVALLTSDELMLSGYTYLNNGQNWYTISPTYWGSGYSATSLMNASTVKIGYNRSGTSYAIRPVVSLSIDAKVSGGNGSSASPYTIEG